MPGVTMGDQLRAADSRNPKDYSEDLKMLRLNDEIIAAA